MDLVCLIKIPRHSNVMECTCNDLELLKIARQNILQEMYAHEQWQDKVVDLPSIYRTFVPKLRDDSHCKCV